MPKEVFNGKSDIERELDAIRIDLYEQTKHITASEKTDFFNKAAAALSKKYGFKIISKVEQRNQNKTPPRKPLKTGKH
jgi:hypothetical protein